GRRGDRALAVDAALPGCAGIAQAGARCSAACRCRTGGSRAAVIVIIVAAANEADTSDTDARDRASLQHASSRERALIERLPICASLGQFVPLRRNVHRDPWCLPDSTFTRRLSMRIMRGLTVFWS